MSSLIESKTGFLPTTAPFDFSQSLRFLGGFSPTAGEQSVSKSGQLTKTISLKGQAVVFSLIPVVGEGFAHDSSQPTAALSHNTSSGVNYTLRANRLETKTVELAERAISKYLGLQDDLGELYAVGANDPAFAPVMQGLYGYHQVRFLTPFENAVWSVLTQRTPMAVARAAKFKLVAHYGPKLEQPGEEKFIAFPEPEAIIAAGASELVTVLDNERKADYLLHVAEAFATDLRFDDSAVDALDRETLKQRLLAIKGIGAWSAEFVLIRGFGKMGGIPGGEKELAKVVGQRYTPGRIATDSEIADFARPYGNSKGYWAHYLRIAGPLH